MKNNELIVSICCVTYNHENYLRQCLDGFVMQKTNFPFEILVHEDASTDGTAAILREYETKFPNLFRCVYQSENQFLKQNTLVNILFKMAKGKYIALCEGDDYWTDQYKLQKQVDFLETSDSYILCASNSKKFIGNHFLDCSECMTYTHDITLDTNNLLIDYTFNPIPTASILFRKSVLNQIDLEFICNCNFGDWPLLIEISQHGKIYFFSDFFSVYRITGKGHYTGISSEQQKMQIVDFFYQVGFKYPHYTSICKEQIIKVWREYADSVAHNWCVFFSEKIDEQKKFLESRKNLVESNTFISLFKLIIIKFITSICGWRL